MCVVSWLCPNQSACFFFFSSSVCMYVVCTLRGPGATTIKSTPLRHCFFFPASDRLLPRVSALHSDRPARPKAGRPTLRRFGWLVITTPAPCSNTCIFLRGATENSNTVYYNLCLCRVCLLLFFFFLGMSKYGTNKPPFPSHSRHN